jgi:rRNA maturation RNase YbeY
MAIWFHTHLRRISVRAKTIQRVTQSILEQAGHPSDQLSLSLVGKTRMRSLNRKYRGRDYPTDVLAFPMESLGKPTAVFLGDVVICLPVAVGQASRFDNTPDQEILRLLIHGTLHLLGYDHERSQREATRMQRKERAIFQTLSPIPPLLASIG